MTASQKVVGVSLALLVVLSGFFVWRTFFRAKNVATAPVAKKKVTVPVNIVPVAERPFTVLAPVDSRNIRLSVMQVKKPATEAEYTLEYQSESSLQGLSGVLEVGSLPAVTKPILLGTCSAGGACTYHKQVQGGSIQLTMTGGADTYALKQDWKYIENPKKEMAFSSRDAFFQVESKDLAGQTLLIIAVSPGYPGTLQGTPLSEVYTLAGMSPVQGTAKMTIRAKEDATGAVMLGWDGSAWQEFPSTVEGKTVTAAQAKLLQAYVVVKK